MDELCPDCGENWHTVEIDHNKKTGDALFKCLVCETEWVIWGSPSVFDDIKEGE